ncbi:MAG: hypothetical protein ABIT01_14860 [Thermoanaerobaculia bacterium]
MRRLDRFAALALVLSPFVAGMPPLSAAGRAYLVRSYTTVSAGDSIGDREAGASGAFWLTLGTYDVTGKYNPRVTRLALDGTSSSWALDATPQSYPPTAVRRDPANGSVWVLVPLFTERQSALYKLDPLSNAVTRYQLTFTATHLTLDPVSGVPWFSGTGNLGRLTGSTQAVFALDNFSGRTSTIDTQRRIWLSADNATLKSFSIDTGTVETYADAQASMVLLDVDSSTGRVWGVKSSQNRLICFTPATREKVEFPLVLTAANWGGIGSGAGGLISVASAYGPHFLSHDPSKMLDGTRTTLAVPTAQPIFAASSTLLPQNLLAVKTDSTETPVDRVVYAENDGGRYLFPTTGVGLVSVLWSDGGNTLTGTSPIQLWQPLSSATSFTTRAVLPVVAEVRPSDPVSNFLTEVTLTNIDASSAVVLTLQTAEASYAVNVTVGPGGTRVFSNIIQSLRDLGASGIPPGSVGTLTARFSNGKGLMAARVYTKFGDGTLFPAGATTGLGYSSIDPATELFVNRSSLNGLKNTAGFRTNVAVANLCGGLGTCPALSVTLQFTNDETGVQVGEKSLQVPPNQVSQVNAPLADFGPALGETFSVLIQPYSEGISGYEAYATVISNTNADAAFIRAEALTASYNLTLPVVTDAGGIGTRFTSECAITSTIGTTAVADVTFTSALSGNSVTEVLTLPANRGVRYPNAVDHFRQLAPDKVAADDYGPIRIALREYATAFASARTTAANGTGLGFTAIDPNIARAQKRKRIVGLKQTDTFRTNLAVVHPGATTSDTTAPITVKVTITDATGNQVGSPLTQTLQPGRLFQWTKILSDSLGVTGEGYVATIERTAGSDAFDAYVTIIDGTTTDPTFLRAE